MNGFTISTWEDWVPNLPCTTDLDIRSESPLDVGYLPPNTYQTHQPQIATCPGGEIWMTVRLFRVSLAYVGMDSLGSRADISVAYFDRTRAIPIPIADVQEVQAGTLNGHPAVFVKPLTPEGYGLSAILIATDDPEVGFFAVSAFNLPFDELMKVAEGVSCSGC